MAERIEKLREIVESMNAAEVEGQFVDLFTASAMVAVHDALSPENKARFGQVAMSRLARFCLSQLK